MVASNLALTIMDLYGDVDSASIKKAVDDRLITADEARSLMGYVVMPPKPLPTQEQREFGRENYEREVAARRDSAPRVILAEKAYRNRHRKAALASPPPGAGYVLRGSHWVRI